MQKRKAVMSVINPTDESVFLLAHTVIATVSEVNPNEHYPFSDYDTLNSKTPPHCANINISNKNSDNDLNFDMSNSDLTPEQKQKLRTFLQKNKDVFSPTLKNLCKTDLYHHTIETLSGEGPVRLPFYRQGSHLKQVAQEMVDEMLEQDIISPSNSVWHSPIVLIKKGDNSYRFAVDYRKLNKITKSTAHPLPRLDSIFDAIGSAKAQFFTTLDLALVLADPHGP